MPDAPNKSSKFALGCIVAAISLLAAAGLVVVGAFFFFKRSFSDFDAHREKMGVRSDLVIREEKLRFSPGFDAAMWCRLTAEAEGIAEVFDPSKVDASQFDNEGYQFRVDWIDDDWWDADARELRGGETEVDDDFLRVGYVDNGDGTHTVYLFWFQV